MSCTKIIWGCIAYPALVSNLERDGCLLMIENLLLHVDCTRRLSTFLKTSTLSYLQVEDHTPLMLKEIVKGILIPFALSSGTLL